MLLHEKKLKAIKGMVDHAAPKKYLNNTAKTKKNKITEIESETIEKGKK